MTTGIILQARLTSERFPNKTMCYLLGKPLIDHMLEKLMPLGYPLVVAIPDTRSNEPLRAYLEDKYPTVQVYRSFEEDLVRRYRDVNSFCNFDPIIRICADSPFFDAEDIKIALEIYNKRQRFTMLNHIQVFGKDELEYAFFYDYPADSRQHVVRGILYTVDYPQDIERIEKDVETGRSPTLNRMLGINAKKEK